MIPWEMSLLDDRDAAEASNVPHCTTTISVRGAPATFWNSQRMRHVALSAVRNPVARIDRKRRWLRRFESRRGLGPPPHLVTGAGTRGGGNNGPTCWQRRPRPRSKGCDLAGVRTGRTRDAQRGRHGVGTPNGARCGWTMARADARAFARLVGLHPAHVAAFRTMRAPRRQAPRPSRGAAGQPVGKVGRSSAGSRSTADAVLARSRSSTTTSGFEHAPHRLYFEGTRVARSNPVVAWSARGAEVQTIDTAS